MLDEAEDLGSKPELTDQERKDLFFSHYRKISAQTDKIALLKDEMRKLRKTAKADGLVLADIDFAMRCAEIEDDSIVVAELKRRTEIAAWFSLPVEFQSDLFANAATPADDRAYIKGQLAKALGKKADPANDGYDASSDQGQAWLRGYHDETAPAKERAKKGAPKGRGKNGDGDDPDPESVRETTRRELAEPNDRMDKTFAQRMREQNDAVDERMKEAAPAFN